jgi:hypothetical protein
MPTVAIYGSVKIVRANQVIMGLFHKLFWQVTGERRLNSRLAPADILLLVH